MDVDAAAFVLDRVDVARVAILEARQTVDKFAQPQDEDIARILDDMLDKAEQLDRMVRSLYPAS